MTVNLVTGWQTTTITTLGYTLPQLVPPTSVASMYTSYTLAEPIQCPEGYATYQGVVCLAPNTDYPTQAPSSEPPITVTTTMLPVGPIGFLGPVAAGSTTIDTWVPEVLTRTVSELYCPAPLTLYGGYCVTAAAIPSYNAAQFAEAAIYFSTATLGSPVATLTSLGQTFTYYSTPSVSGITPMRGGPSATLTTAGIKVTLYTPPVLPSVAGASQPTTMLTQATTTALVSQISDGQVQATTGASASTTVAPYKGAAAAGNLAGGFGMTFAVAVAVLVTGMVIVL